MQSVRKHHSSGKSWGIFFLILCIHSLFICWMLRLQTLKPAESVPLLTYIRLPQHIPSPLYPEPSIVDFTHAGNAVPKIAAPEVVIESGPVFDLTLDSPPPQGDFSGVFDPRLRQKLLQTRRGKNEQGLQIDERWTGADGRTYIYAGNGECVVSMAKLDWRERGTQWSSTRVACGKNDSENMMDRVMADFESRKARK